MKLHLPTRLRAAVIACMAAFAPMAVTVATGTLTAAAVATYLAPLALAETYEITGNADEHWSTAVAGDVLDVNLTGNWLPLANTTVLADVSVTSMVINNGSKNTTYIFSGALSGSGAMSQSFKNQTWNFTGDVSGYTGAITWSVGTGTLSFSGDSAINAASITTSSTLSLSGTRTVAGTVSATKTSIGAGSAITLSNTGAQSLGALTVDVSSCTDTSASLLTVSGDLTVGSLTLSNYSSLAAGTYNLITLKDADAATALKATLTDATEYTFSTEDNVLKVTMTGDVYVVTTSGDTKLTSAAAGDKLIINLTGWLPNGYPMKCLADVEIQKMILDDGSSGRTYQFEGAVTGSGPIQYTKAGVTGYTLAFIGDFSGYTGDIDFTGNSTATLRFANTTVKANAINLNCTLNLQGAVVMDSPVVTVATTLTESAAVTINNTFTTDTLTEATGCSITIGDAGNLTVGGDLDVAGLNITSTGTLTLADDASVTGETINIGGAVAVTSGTTIAVDDMTAVGTGPDLTVTGLQSAGEYQIIGADTSVTGLDQATFTLAGVEQTATVTDKNVQLGTFFNIAATDSKTVAEVIAAAGGASYDYINALGTLSGVSDAVTTLAPVAGTGTVVVDGTLATKVSSLSTFTGTVQVVEGGALQTSSDVTAAVQLAGGELTAVDGVTMTSNIAVTKASTIASTGSTTLSGVLSGSGDITKNGDGTLALSGNLTNTGTLTINGGSVRWGVLYTSDTSTYENQTTSIAFSNIIVNSGARFDDSHKGADYSTTNITLNDGTLYAHAQAASSLMKYGTLTVAGTGNIQAYWKAYREFAVLTSAADADATLNFGGGNWDGNSYTTIDKINNFDGTINPGSFGLNLSTVNQEAGYEATVSGTATSTNFLKTGDGALTLTALNVSGTLGMNYGGTLDITTLTLKGDTVLSYDSSLTGGVLTLSSMDNVTTLDLDKVTIGTDGFDLGIVSTVDEATLKSALSLYDDTQYTLDNSGTDWVIKGAVVVKTDWDKNWGAAVLASQPAAVTQAELTTTTALVGSTYDDGTTTAIELTGGGTTSVDVYGGASETSATCNSWIKATGGTYGILVGGNYANNWGSGTRADFVGDSHIMLDGATVNHIVGANLKDGQGAGFTGSTYISVVSGAVNGSVVGGVAVAHANSTTLSGSTHIYVYTALAAGSTSLMSGTANAVIGGTCWGTNIGSLHTIAGDTNIMLDMNTVTDAATFGKRIIGSGFMASNISTKVGGSTNISITNAGNVTFSEEVVGASHSEGSGTTTVGTTNLTIDSGTFTGNVIGGSYMASSGSDVITATNVTISGGTFSGPVAAGSWMSGGSSTIGSTTLTITDGTFTSDVYGGDRANATTNTISGKATTSISGGTFGANVVGAGCDAGSGTKLTVGGVEMSLTGGSITGNVIGGVYDTATGSVANTHSVGDINLTVDGATVNGNIYGGSYMQRNAATGSATTGNVTVNLTSGSVKGNVYGAGLVNGTAKQTTAAVTVNVGKDTTFTGTSQIISGGFGGSKATNGTVTGGSTLTLAADAQTAAVTAADFTTISVADGAAALQAVTGTSTAKTGAGALTVTDKVSSNALDVQAGALTLTAGADNLNSGALAVSVASGATLTTGAALTGVSSLTLSNGSSLGIGSLTTGAAALADNATVSFGTVNLASTAAAAEGIVLLTNVTEAQLKTITWTTDAAGQRSVAASTALASMTLNGAAVTLSDYKLVIDDTAKTLSIAKATAADLYWEGGASGTWDRTTTNTPWSTTDGGAADSSFLNTAPVHFTTTGDVAVTVGEAVNTPTLSVEKGNVTLTDATKLTASAISVAKDASLIIDGLANDTAAVTNNGTLTSTATDLTVASLDNAGTVNAAGLSVTGNVTGTGDIGATGALSVGGNTAAGDISAASADFTGNVTATKISTTGALSVGGTTTASEISADSATFTGAASVTKLTTTGATTNNGGLTIGDGSSLGSLAGTGDLTTSGTVGITGAATAGTVTNNGTLTAASLTATKLSGTGNTTVTGTLSLGGSDTTGAVSADKVTLTGNASFGKLTATNGVTAAGTLSVGADSSLGAVTGVTTLTTTGTTSLTSVNDGAAIAANGATTITGTQATSLSGLSGTGTLTTGGDLTLTTAPNSTQAVTTTGALTLSAGGKLGATTVNGTTLTLGDDTTLASLGGALTTIAVTEGAIDTATTILTIGGNLTPTTLSYTLADSDLTSIGAYLSNGNSYTLTSVTGTNSLTSVTLNGTGTEFDGSGYKLTISVSGKTVILTKSATGNEWISTDGKWTSDSGFIEVVPTTGTAAFYGNGTAGVAVTGAKTVSAVHVEIPDAGTVQEYTFTGDSVTTSTLDIVKGGLVLKNTVNATTSTIDENGTLTIGDGGTLSGTTMTNDGTVTVDDGGTVTLSGALTNNGTLDVNDGTLSANSLSNTKEATLNLNKGSEAKVTKALTNEGSLTVADGGSLTVGSLAGSGSLTVGKDGTLVVEDGVVSKDTLANNKGTIELENLSNTDKTSTIAGTIVLTGDGSYAGSYATGTTVEVANGATQSLVAASNLTAKADTGSDLTIDVTAAPATIDAISATDADVTIANKAGESATNTLTLTKASDIDGGTLTLSVSAKEVINNTDKPVLTTGAALNLTDTDVVINQTETTAADIDISAITGDTDIVLFYISDNAASTVDTDTCTLTVNSSILKKYFSNIHMEQGSVEVLANRRTTFYTESIGGETENGRAGLALASNALSYIDPQVTAPTGALAGVLDALDDYDDIINDTTSTPEAKAAALSGADNLASALTGASVAAMGSALAGDVDRQLRAIRNRTTTMGVNQGVVNEDMPYFNAWINAEGDYRKVSQDGTLAGYELSSWGGTVGFDVDCTPTFTCGLAMTAMYGDFTAKSAEKAEGDLDTYYVSAFGRYAKHRWTHTFVATVGLADTSLDRTVNGSKVTGDSDGFMLGALYEVGYVIPIDKEAETCLQPIVNVAVKHTTLNGYSESGSDLALKVDDVDMTTVTFGAGARLQTVIGESIYNRSSILEARALAKVDAGDRQAELNSTFAGAALSSVKAKAAETGAFGAEFGVGLTVPVGQESGSIFVDGSAEIRADYVNVNATVGYRVNF